MAYLAFFTIVFQPLMGYNSYIIIKEFKPSAYIFGRFIFRYRGEFMGSNVKTYTKKELVGYLAGMFGQTLYTTSFQQVSISTSRMSSAFRQWRLAG